MKPETLHHESNPESSCTSRAVQRGEAPLMMTQSPHSQVPQFQQQRDGKPRDGKDKRIRLSPWHPQRPGCPYPIGVATEPFSAPAPPLSTAASVKVTWLQQQVCCGGCWCLTWLAAGSQGIWRDADQRLHRAVRFPPKKSLEMAAGMEKELSA